MTVKLDYPQKNIALITIDYRPLHGPLCQSLERFVDVLQSRPWMHWYTLGMKSFLGFAPLTPIDGVAADLSRKRKGQHAGETGDLFGFTVLVNANSHVRMTITRLIDIGSEKSIPQG